MLKKITLVIISLAVAGIAGYCLSNLVHDKAINPESLPESVKSFMNTHFPEDKIAFSKKDRDFLKMSYEVILTDGTKLEFRRSGEWKEIDRHHDRLPDGIIPQEVEAKITELYPDSFITKAENGSRNMEVDLANGLELKFDKRNSLIGIDR